MVEISPGERIILIALVDNAESMSNKVSDIVNQILIAGVMDGWDKAVTNSLHMYGMSKQTEKHEILKQIVNEVRSWDKKIDS